MMNNIIQHYPKYLKNELKDIINSFKEVEFNEKVIHLNFIDSFILEFINDISLKYKSVEVLKLYNYDEEERVYVILKPLFFDIKLPEIVYVDVLYNKKYKKLEHRHVLGTLLNSEINFQYIGDILVDDNNNIQIICHKKIFTDLQIFCENISSLNITYKINDNMIVKHNNKTIKEFYLTSLRIDTIVKTVIKKNRTYAQKLIKQKYVKVNQIQINSNTKTCEIYDIISIRGFGRFKIIQIENLSNNKYRVSFEY